MAETLATLRQVAPSDLTVLLVGESGVGKEVLAHAVHRLSPRRSNRMLAINCGAIPETLLESELFGHEKGAFTGAIEARKGLFESADGGTVLLDEVGEMPITTQVKLLRVLETFEYTRVGSSEPRHANVRVIAATNRDLEREIRRGNFRQDLYYRLALAQIRVPALRERPEDIPLLVAHFAFSVAERLGIPFGGVTPEAMELLEAYRWPGNIRELKNLVELLVTLERGGKITEDTIFRHLGPSEELSTRENPAAIVHLPGRTSEQVERELIYRALIDLRNEVGAMKELLLRRNGEPSSQPYADALAALPAPDVSIDEALDRLDDLRLVDMERRLVEKALERHKWSRRAAAQSLGISERTLYRKITEYALDGDGEPQREDPTNDPTNYPTNDPANDPTNDPTKE